MGAGDYRAPPLRVWIQGVGVLGPGLPDWHTARIALLDPGRWVAEAVSIPIPIRLPPTERRRCGEVVKLSIAVAEQAVHEAGVDSGTLATVFSSSGGDGDNCHALCMALATADRTVSPTRFTNSVHNAPAGYWHVATANRAPSVSMCSHDTSFGSGLVEAVSQCLSWQRRVLLVSVDTPYPEPLSSVRPIAAAFGCALVVSPMTLAGCRSVTLDMSAGSESRCADVRLERLRQGVPAARALPLLQALADKAGGRVVLGLGGGLAAHLSVDGPG